jgi:hypothetical protein
LTAVAAGVGGGGLGLCCLIAIIAGLLFCRQKKKKAPPCQPQDFCGVDKMSGAIALTVDGTVTLRDLTLREKLGGGNFGEVFRGIWMRNGNPEDVALKRLKSKEQFQEFMDEVHTLRYYLEDKKILMDYKVFGL